MSGNNRYTIDSNDATIDSEEVGEVEGVIVDNAVYMEEGGTEGRSGRTGTSGRTNIVYTSNKPIYCKSTRSKLKKNCNSLNCCELLLCLIMVGVPLMAIIIYIIEGAKPN